MLNPHEIYVLGKAVVDENQDCYYRTIETGMISSHPEKLIACIDVMIAKLERVKNFASDYQKAHEEENKDEPEW